jgi:phospholipase/carboxylesterase
MSLLPHIVVEPSGTASASVIWLHGLGADGHDFEAIVPQLRMPANSPIRFIFPHAPSMPVTINNGMVMPAWYDILEMTLSREVDEISLNKSVKAIEAILENEIELGIKSERIVLAGFSQGGAVAYQLGLNITKPIAGILALSTYIASEKLVTYDAVNKGMNIQVCHGTFDPVVPEFLGKKAHETLSGRGYEANYKSYPMEHSVCAEEIADISVWLQEVLP